MHRNENNTPSVVLNFPLLLYCLEEDVPEFCMDLVCCQNKHRVFSVFYPDHEFSIDAEACSFIKDEI